MDYAENCKMMEEEEFKEYLFPQNDYRLVKFNTFNTEQQLNSIFVGSLITEIGEDKYIRLKSGENQVEKDKLLKAIDNIEKQDFVLEKIVIIPIDES